MNPNTPFKATLLATLAATAWSPAGSWAQYLNLAQSPPATVEPFVAPNVILSLDDSGSMRYVLTSATVLGNANLNQPNADGTWPTNASRVNILRHALKTVFEDRQLLPDGSIRFAWQTMGRCGNGGDGWTSMTLDAGKSETHSMRVLDGTHRQNFLSYIGKLTGCAWTPTHTMVSQADRYMRAPLGINSPWASEPGKKGAPYLGCRRNYHILMTDGGWNYAIRSSGNQIPGSPNFDGTSRTLPDGTPYATTDPQTQIYRDNDAGSFSTIADWAFKSWADPLQATGLTGSPSPSTEYRRAPAQETFTSSTKPASSVTLNKYWNPRYNPATWPHMVTFTVGFSQFALPHSNYTANGRTPIAAPPSGTVPYGYDGNFADYANGTFAWRAAGSMTMDRSLPTDDQADRGHDMWHAAINGRGKFYAVNRSEDLATAFRQIVQQISTESEPGRSSAATSGSTITRSAVGLYNAHYDPQQAWRGWITGQSVALATDGSGNTSTTAIKEWQGKSTAQRLDELSDTQVLGNRTILGWNDDSGRGVPFQWTAIGATQQAHLNRASSGTADGRGAQRLNYLRGVRSMEGTASPPSYPANRPFRQRQSRQGDIINSAIWYTGAPTGLDTTQAYQSFAATHKDRTPMLYVGGNDGMLHGFSARDGSEKLAYVPRGVMPGLSALTEPGYDDRHRYFVDGSPMTGDVLDGTWKTLLVGTLGAGGKGYFVLDASNPGGLREADANALVLLDRSMHATENRPADCSLLTDSTARDPCEADKDMGHIFAAPVLDDSNPQRSTQITHLNNGRWAVVMGNGYNSQNGRPVLLVQYLDQGRELLRLQAQAGTSSARDNGLSAPRLVDINGDGRPDVAYAGDLQGNLWKFIIASQDSAQWGVAFDGAPLFTLSGTATGSNAPSITAPPTVRANDRKQIVKNSAGQQETLVVGGMMVAFGTGRNVTVQDPFDNNPGTIYSVLDNTRYKQVEGKDGRSLVEPCLSTTDAVCKLSAGQEPSTVLPSQLIDLTQDRRTVTGTAASAGRTFTKIEGGGVDWTTHRGWRFQLPERGERLLKPMAFYDSSNILAIYSQIPARTNEIDIPGTQETCEAATINSERQFLTLLNIMDGKAPSVQIMDANGDGLYNAADGAVNRMTTSSGAQSQIDRGDRIVVKGGKDEEDVFARMPEQPARPSWRQLQ